MKRFLSFLLVFLLILTTAIVNFSAFADETGAVGKFKSVYQPSTGIIVPPTVVQKIDSQDDFTSVYSSKQPTQVAYFCLDDSGENIVFADGTTKSLLNAFTNCDNKVIPMFEVNTETAAQALVAFVKSNDATDIIATSSNTDVLEYIFEQNRTNAIGANRYIRNAYQIKNDDKLKDIAYNAATDKATLAISYKTLTRSEMEYLQARFLSVWSFSENVKNATENNDIIDNAATRAVLDNGANGVFVTDPKTPYALYESVTNANVRCRRPINIAHRGLSNKYPDNTLEGMIGAYEAGADAVECDIYKTCETTETNKCFVVTHDVVKNNYNLLTNTRADVKANVDLSNTETPVRVPYLDEMFDVLALEKYKDKVLVIEIKIDDNYKDYIADTKAVYDLAVEKGVQNQITFISFNNDLVLKNANQNTNVPLATLMNYGTSENMLMVCSRFNGISDVAGAGAYAQDLAYRGMATISWTSTYEQQLRDEVNTGISGNTTNLADTMNEIYKDDKYLTAEKILAQNDQPTTTTAKYEDPENYDGPYVASKFYANFDGKNYGDDSSVWKSTINSSTANVGTADENNNKFTEEGYLNNSRKCAFSDDIVSLIQSKEFTVEINFGEFTSIGNSFNTILNSNNDSFSLFRRVNNDVLELKSGEGGANQPRPTVSGANSFLADSTISVSAKVGGKAKIYVNGELKAEQNYSKTSNADNFFFGHNDVSKAFKALFKSIRFYAKELSAEEILQNAKVDNTATDSKTTSASTAASVTTQQTTSTAKPSVTQPTTNSSSNGNHQYHNIYDADTNGTSMNGYLNGANVTVDWATFNKGALAVTKSTSWDELGFSLTGDFGSVAENPIGIRIWVAGNTAATNYSGLSLGFGSGNDYKNRYATAARFNGNFKLTAEGAYYEYYWNTNNTVYKMYDGAATRTFSSSTSASAQDIFTADFLKELNQIYFIMQDPTIAKDTAFYIDDVDLITDGPSLTLLSYGASIRLKSDTTGLRFATKIDKAEVKALEEKGYNIELGTLIAPMDKFEDSELTLDSPEENFINVKFNKEHIGKVIEDCMVGSIVSIRKNNIPRNFLGRGYAKITKEGEKDIIIYANNYKSEPRSIAYVSYRFQKDENNIELYNQFQELVDDWAAFFVNDPNTKDIF